MSTDQLTVLAERDFAGDDSFLGDIEAQTGMAAPQGDFTTDGQTEMVSMPGRLENRADRAASVDEALSARRIAARS